ncbi:MAG: hypothetical protein HRT47_05435 [Candidatus Caenarcaniphilales bacterium]|nr:hypothetical protein [Candidatus Caenarcaniphilales bacterium]
MNIKLNTEKLPQDQLNNSKSQIEASELQHGHHITKTKLEKTRESIKAALIDIDNSHDLETQLNFRIRENNKHIHNNPDKTSPEVKQAQLNIIVLEEMLKNPEDYIDQDRIEKKRKLNQNLHKV